MTSTTSTPIDDQPTTSQLPAGRLPLQRSGTDAMLGGVCGGLAASTGIDAVLWRVGALVLTFTGPGLFVYLLLWLLMPQGPVAPGSTPNAAERLMSRLRNALTGRQPAPPAA